MVEITSSMNKSRLGWSLPLQLAEISIYEPQKRHGSVVMALAKLENSSSKIRPFAFRRPYDVTAFAMCVVLSCMFPIFGTGRCFKKYPPCER